MKPETKRVTKSVAGIVAVVSLFLATIGYAVLNFLFLLFGQMGGKASSLPNNAFVPPCALILTAFVVAWYYRSRWLMVLLLMLVVIANGLVLQWLRDCQLSMRH